MSEHNEQVSLFEWAEWNISNLPELAWMFHVPNGGHRHKAVAAQMKALGTKKGVPDVWLPVARYDAARNVTKNGVVIELKFGKNKATDEQRAWLGFLARQGWEVHTCYDWTAAARILVTYLGHAPERFGL